MFLTWFTYVLIDPIDGVSETIDDEKDLVDSNFEKMDEQDDIHIAYAKDIKKVWVWPLTHKKGWIGKILKDQFKVKLPIDIPPICRGGRDA